jgi:hypothetical protein
MSDRQDGIKQLVARDKLAEAAAQLVLVFRDESPDTDLYNQAIGLQASVRDIKKKESMGMLSFSDVQLRLNQLRSALLTLADEIGKQNVLANPVAPAGKTTILFLAANPTDTGKLRLDKEYREIDEGLRLASRRDQFELESKFAVRPKDLRRAMLDYNPGIVHFSGHGEKSSSRDVASGLSWETDEVEAASTGGIALEDELGHTKLVSSEALGNLFELYDEVVQCVILNACYSENQANAIVKHIPYVIGMNRAVNDETAIAFALGFYDALGAGKDYETAFKHARNAIELEALPGDQIPVLKKKAGTP